MTTTISNGNVSAAINHHGAELISLTYQGREYLWDGNPEFWGKHSPVLFPIVGTLKNDKYLFNDRQYHLNRHGFARDMVFSLESKTDESATFLLKSDSETLKVYPFDFELRIVYSVSAEAVTIAYRVSNLGDGQQYFSLGAHPAFALPEPFANYALEMVSAKTLVSSLLDNGLLSGRTMTLPLIEGRLPLDYALFDTDALIFRNAGFHSLTLLENQKPILKVDFEDFPDLGLWTKTGAAFLCIEPWLGYADALDANHQLKEKPGIIALEPAQDFNAQFKITLL
ncbi:aldose epimerase [Flavobacterium magnum]|uniref:Aldose epimerase n=1 Tax=Flavobacterium magnum TaxID=2162713 RepID=A0A2S0REN8_9FLAO|nr:aldose 1-epimerase family protein [Flavobacterium magnum]AWA30085.1 aldose epimerase [Flavobacterium magnum]